MKLHLFLALLIPFCLNTILCAQNVNKARSVFKIEYERTNKNKKLIKSNDTLFIDFDYQFHNDVVLIKSSKGSFQSDTLNSNNVYGFGGKMKILKTQVNDKIELYFNGQLIKSFKIDLNYSEIHLKFDRERNEFTWRYHKYKFAYL